MADPRFPFGAADPIGGALTFDAVFFEENMWKNKRIGSNWGRSEREHELMGKFVQMWTMCSKERNCLKFCL